MAVALPEASMSSLYRPRLPLDLRSKYSEALEFDVPSSSSQELTTVTALPVMSARAEAGMVTQASTMEIIDVLRMFLKPGHKKTGTFPLNKIQVQG
jgi:hypothetical protein